MIKEKDLQSLQGLKQELESAESAEEGPVRKDYDLVVSMPSEKRVYGDQEGAKELTYILDITKSFDKALADKGITLLDVVFTQDSGVRLSRKSEVHLTCLGFGHVAQLDEIAEKYPEGREAFKQRVSEILSDVDFSLTIDSSEAGLGLVENLEYEPDTVKSGEKFESERTIVVDVNTTGIRDFYKKMQEEFDIELGASAAHATLYIQDQQDPGTKGLGIALIDKELQQKGSLGSAPHVSISNIGWDKISGDDRRDEEQKNSNEKAPRKGMDVRSLVEHPMDTNREFTTEDYIYHGDDSAFFADMLYYNMDLSNQVVFHPESKEYRKPVEGHIPCELVIGEQVIRNKEEFNSAFYAVGKGDSIKRFAIRFPDNSVLWLSNVRTGDSDNVRLDEPMLDEYWGDWFEIVDGKKIMDFRYFEMEKSESEKTDDETKYRSYMVNIKTESGTFSMRCSTSVPGEYEQSDFGVKSSDKGVFASDLLGIERSKLVEQSLEFFEKTMSPQDALKQVCMESAPDLYKAMQNEVFASPERVSWLEDIQSEIALTVSESLTSIEQTGASRDAFREIYSKNYSMLYTAMRDESFASPERWNQWRSWDTM